MLMCMFLVHVAHETAGAARIRHSLRPLNIEGETICKTSGASRREIAKSHPQSCCRPGLDPGPSIPETPMIEPRSRGVLDPPHARVTRQLCVELHHLRHCERSA